MAVWGGWFGWGSCREGGVFRGSVLGLRAWGFFFFEGGVCTLAGGFLGGGWGFWGVALFLFLGGLWVF